jgi:hypothetical protein
MSGSPSHHLKTGRSPAELASRSLWAESSRLADIVKLARRIGTRPLIPRSLATKPVSFAREYLLRSQTHDEKGQTVFGRIGGRDTLLINRPSPLRINNDYSNRGHIPTSRRFDHALRPPEWDLNAVHGWAIIAEGSALKRDERASALQVRITEGQGARRIIHQPPVALRYLFSPAPKSVPRPLRLTANRPLSPSRRKTSFVTSGNSKVPGSASQSSGLREIVRPLVNLWEGVNQLVQALRPSLEAQAVFLARTPAATHIAPTEHFVSEAKLAAGRANGYRGSLISRESSHPSSSEGRYADQRVPQHRLNPTGATGVHSNSLTKGSPTARLVAQLRGQQSASQQSEFVQPIRARTRTTRFSDNSGEMRNPLTVNFSPTVVIQSESEHGSIEGRVVEAIRRHSYENVRLIGRELQTQRRAVF